MSPKFLEKIVDYKDPLLKWALTIVESICFVLIIVFSSIIMGNIIAGIYYIPEEMGTDPVVIGLSICCFIFLTFPFLLRVWLNFIDHQIKKMHRKEFRANFIEFIKSKTYFSIEDIAHDFHVSSQDVFDYIQELVEKGVLRGKIIHEKAFGERFELDPNFQIKSIYERRVDHFKKTIGRFLRAYKVISLNKIATAFQLPESEIEKLLREEIASERISGFIDGKNFIHELSALLQQNNSRNTMEPCPYCDKDNLVNALYCSWCGKSIVDLDEMDR